MQGVGRRASGGVSQLCEDVRNPLAILRVGRAPARIAAHRPPGVRPSGLGRLDASSVPENEAGALDRIGATWERDVRRPGMRHGANAQRRPRPYSIARMR